jgi:hypothetical protein
MTLVFEPHRAKSLIVKEITDYQIQVLLLLHLGCTANNTEGANFKCWFEDMLGKKVDYPLRKDTLGNLVGVGLLEERNQNRHGVCSYKLAIKGSEVLNLLKDVRKAPNIKRLAKLAIS